ncbi:MAG: hypothetical protein KAW95_03175, partial [Dehalococcoidia bacterium]|nr:hypothetical protein [Dehalococcoidia bacterium]
TKSKRWRCATRFDSGSADVFHYSESQVAKLDWWAADTRQAEAEKGQETKEKGPDRVGGG